MKTIKEIQEENRKIILPHVYTDKYPIRLSEVLLTTSHKEIGFYDGSLVEVTESTGYYREEYIESLCKWDLTKPTLEEQTEETQGAINKLLTDK